VIQVFARSNTGIGKALQYYNAYCELSKLVTEELFCYKEGVDHRSPDQAISSSEVVMPWELSIVYHLYCKVTLFSVLPWNLICYCKLATYPFVYEKYSRINVVLQYILYVVFLFIAVNVGICCSTSKAILHILASCDDKLVESTHNGLRVWQRNSFSG